MKHAYFYRNVDNGIVGQKSETADSKSWAVNFYAKIPAGESQMTPVVIQSLHLVSGPNCGFYTLFTTFGHHSFFSAVELVTTIWTNQLKFFSHY